jgi:hypothetical protein
VRATRVAIATAAVVGTGLFGSSVHGLTQVDGRLAEDQQRQVREVKQERPEGGVRDCPRRELRRL